MTDVDHTLRAHADEAARAELDPAAWDRLVARLEEPPLVVAIDGRTGRDGRPGRVPLLVAAAVVLVVLVAAGVALARSGDEGSAPVATAPPPSTASSGPPPTPGFRSDADIDQASRPDRIVAVVDHDGDGLPDLVRIDDLQPYDEEVSPEPTVLVSGASVAPDRIRSVEVGADGTALYGVCCDRLEGEVRAVDVADGTDLGTIAVGTSPAVSGDGRLLATVTEGGRVSLLDRETDDATWFDGPTGAHDEVTGLSVSPDGTTLARERVTRGVDGTVVDTAVDVTATDDPDGWEPIERSSGAGLPAFMPDGHLALGLGTYATSAGEDEVHASEVGMADLSTGVVRWSVGGGGFSFTFFDATPDGRWVIVGQEGVVRAFAAVDGWLYDNGTVGGEDGMVDAAW